MKWSWAILVFTAGCSSAPVADTLDWLRPARISRDDRPDNDRPPPNLPPINERPQPKINDPLGGPPLTPIPKDLDSEGPPPLPPPPKD